MWLCSCFSKTYEAPDVTEIDLRHNNLTEIPEEIAVYDKTLLKLDLSANQIHDLPEWLFRCVHLKELNLNDNQLTLAPDEFNQLARLQKLEISRNAIADFDPLMGNKNLVYLDISLNHLQSTPEAISHLTNLEDLRLNDTCMSFFPASYGRLTKLRILDIRDNALEDLPQSLCRLTNLTRLDIGNNLLMNLPDIIGCFVNLTEFYADNNKMPELTKVIGYMPKLVTLDFSSNICISIHESIEKCTQLIDVTLSKNRIHALPAGFYKLTNLTVLRMDTNHMDTLPDAIGDLINLQELSFVRNMLFKLPPAIGKLKRLHTLYAASNELTELPDEICNCTSLAILTLTNNRLTKLPKDFGNLKALKVLFLVGNLLPSLPASIANIPGLGAIWLQGTQNVPLVPLQNDVNEEGEPVLTCFLLPQVDPPPPVYDDDGEEIEVEASESDESSRPRSAPHIRFCTDDELAMTIQTMMSAKRGLARAPTPYPKDLRSYAKAASNLRSSRDSNGEIPNTDEPVYEGDMVDSQSEPPTDVEGGEYCNGNSQDPSPRSPIRTYEENPAVDSLLSRIDETNKRGLELSQNLPKLSSDFGDDGVGGVRKSPPPYHVAARRAAFFRSNNSGLPSPALEPTSNLGDIPLSPISRTSQFQMMDTRSPGPGNSYAHQPYNQYQCPPSSFNDPPGFITQEELSQVLSIGKTVLSPPPGPSNPTLFTQPQPSQEVLSSLPSAPMTFKPKSYNRPERAIQPEDVCWTVPIVHNMSGNHEVNSPNHRDNAFFPVLSPRGDVLNRTYILERNEIKEQEVEVIQVRPANSDEIGNGDISTDLIERLEREESNEENGKSSRELSETIESRRGPDGDSFSQITTTESKREEVHYENHEGEAPLLTRIPAKSRLPMFQPRGRPEDPPRDFSSAKNLVMVKDGEPSGASGLRLPKVYSLNSHGGERGEEKKPEIIGPKPTGLKSRPATGLPVKVKSNELNHYASTTLQSSASSSRIPRFGESRIPKLNDGYGTTSPPPSEDEGAKEGEQVQASPTNISPSKIPTMSGKKPWIFGTHKNARVVPLEYKKKDQLGFTVIEGGTNEAHGIYIDSIIGHDDGTVKVGDKVLQVDGIDVANMSVDIVLKILGNCQETLHILVSRSS